MEVSKSKVFLLFESFSRTELNQLGQFVHSPFHNSHPKVILLFEHLRELNSTRFQAVKDVDIYNILYPDTNYDDQKLRLVMTYLMKVMEDFLTWQEFSKNKVQNSIILANIYKKRKISKLFSTTIVKTKKLLSKQQSKGLDYYLNDFKLNNELFEASLERQAAPLDNLQKLSDSIDVYFVVNKLKSACSILSHQKLYKVDYQLSMVNDAIKHIESSELIKTPIVEIYYFCYKTLIETQNHQYFQKLKALLTIHQENLNLGDLRAAHLIAINFAIQRYNEGKKEFIPELFELYQKGLENKTLIKDNEITPWTYKNVAAIGIMTKNYEWIIKFLEEFKPYLPQKYRQSMYDYNKALTEFALLHYSNVSDILSNFNSKDTFTNISARVLLIKSYFESGEFDLMEYNLDSLKQLLLRRDVLVFHQKTYNNFQKIMKKVIKLTPNDKKAKEKLIQEIQSKNILAEKEWLLEILR